MNHSRPGFLTPSGLISAGLTVLVVVVIGVWQGGVIFNPGALNALTGAPLGGAASHAAIGGKCSACHAPFWGAVRMADLCMRCHTNIPGELTDSQSLHSILVNNGFAMNCQDCHHEHRGATAKTTNFLPAYFPHLGFGFPLLGKHAEATCLDCHANEDYIQTKTDCVSCHAKEDTHKGKLTDCSICHSPSGWKPPTFDHDTAIFKLKGKHAPLACGDCHVNDIFKGTPTDCAACHAKDDVHEGALGTKCADCHTADGWKPSTFDHNTAIFPLTGKHVPVACADCHTDKRFKGAPTDCISCHAKDDVHLGNLGSDCKQCHTTAGWVPSTFDHNTSIFPLTGKHFPLACNDCHTDKIFKGTPTSCANCHAKDDVHKGKLGSECTACHTTDGWTPSTFDHNNSVFRLTGKHAFVACTSCHPDKTFVGRPTSCSGCHSGNDPHRGRFGSDCGLCHTTSGWKPATFDHNLARFKLTGRHARVPCANCHTNGLLGPTPTSCNGCHNDPHGGRFGANCSTCHSTSAWSPASFNHNLVGFPLTGAHAGLACSRCHGGSILSSPPTDCVGCHAEPAYHAGLFGTNCGQCHNTNNWSASYSGPHPNNCDGSCLNHRHATCRDCHPNTLASATCLKCHDSNNPGDGD
jgi:hypothetical protein